MRIQHNIAALNSYRQLGNNNNNVSKNLERLSSGFRINKAGDDAAGLSISEKMRSQIKGLETAQKNANDGISMIQTAEGNLQEVHSMLNRMVELATQSANGTYSDFNRQQLQKEIDSLNGEVDRIAQSANFNGLKLLDGTMGGGTTGAKFSSAAGDGLAAGAIDATISGPDGVKVTFAATTETAGKKVSATWGTDGNLTISIGGKGAQTITQADIDAAMKAASTPDRAKGLEIKLNKDIAITADTKAGDALGNATTAKATSATSVGANPLTNSDGKATTVEITNGNVGASTSTVTFSATGGAAVGATLNADGTIGINLDGNKSYNASEINAMLQKAGSKTTVKFDGALKGTDLSTNGSTNGAGVFTFGAGTGAKAGSGLAGSDGLTLQVGDTNEAHQKVAVSVGNMNAASLGISSIDISGQGGAQSAIDSVNAAIDMVSATRGDLGALQNRLDHTINNIGVAVENMTAAESRIRDTDMAKEMMEFTKNNILTQAAQAMLAQANTLPQGVLQLLQ